MGDVNQDVILGAYEADLQRGEAAGLNQAAQEYRPPPVGTVLEASAVGGEVVTKTIASAVNSMDTRIGRGFQLPASTFTLQDKGRRFNVLTSAMKSMVDTVTRLNTAEPIAQLLATELQRHADAIDTSSDNSLATTTMNPEDKACMKAALRVLAWTIARPTDFTNGERSEALGTEGWDTIEIPNSEKVSVVLSAAMNAFKPESNPMVQARSSARERSFKEERLEPLQVAATTVKGKNTLRLPPKEYLQ